MFSSLLPTELSESGPKRPAMGQSGNLSFPAWLMHSKSVSRITVLCQLFSGNH